MLEELSGLFARSKDGVRDAQVTQDSRCLPFALAMSGLKTAASRRCRKRLISMRFSNSSN